MNLVALGGLQVVWVPLVSGWGLAAVLLLGLLLVVLSWRGTRGLPRRQRGLIVGLRVLVLFGLGVVIHGPQQVHLEERGQREVLAVLLDSSRSMRVEDSQEGSRAATVGEWLRARAPEFEDLERGFDVRFFLLGNELRPWLSAPNSEDGGSDIGGLSEATARAALGGGGIGAGGPIPADDEGTDLGTGLYGLRSALGGRRPAGVLLVSDGADRAALGRAEQAGGREGVVELLKNYSSPVSTWTVGAAEDLSDLSLVAVHAPPFGFVRRPLKVTLDVRRSGLPEEKVTVKLLAEGDVVAIKDAALDASGEGQLEFELRPDRIGYHSYQLVTTVPAGDVIPTNNQIEFTVKVVRDRTRVLQVSSRPSWDVKFLRRLLKTDPNIDLVSFFILRTSDYEGDLARREPLSLIAFPYEELFTQDLQGFDLVIFQNFWFGSFANFSDDHFLSNVARFVEEGGALMMIGGDLMGEADYGNSPLASVLPTGPPRSLWTGESRSAELTTAGLRHPVTRLARDPEANEQRWKDLPALHGHNSSGKELEGGVTLLSSGGGAEPLLAVRSVGRGRSLLFASDSSWRWALGNIEGGGAGRDHSTLWRNSIRWLVKDAEERQVQVVTDRENYQVGEEIALQVRVLNADYSPKVGESVRVRARAIGNGRMLHESEVVTDDAGQVSLQLEAKDVGTHSIEAEVDSISDPFGRAEARISVLDRDGELENPRTRPGLMEAIAEATGGRALKGRAPDPREISIERSALLRATEEQTEPLWDKNWVLLLLGLPLGLEWVVRRRAGLS